MSVPKPIGHKGLEKLLRGANVLQGKFNPDKRDGYQIIALQHVPLMANGKRVGERMEWHIVTVGTLSGEPDIWLHVSYGEALALRLIVLDEIERAAKHHVMPFIGIKRAYWGGGLSEEKVRPAHFTVDAGGDVKHDIHHPVYVLSTNRCHLHLATFGIEDRAVMTFGRLEWSVERDDNTVDAASYHYTFDPELDASSKEAAKKAG